MIYKNPQYIGDLIKCTIPENSLEVEANISSWRTIELWTWTIQAILILATELVLLKGRRP